MGPWLSPGRFLLQTASESFEEGGCGLPSEEQAVEEIRTVSSTEWEKLLMSVFSLHYLWNISFVLNFLLSSPEHFFTNVS